MSKRLVSVLLGAIVIGAGTISAGQSMYPVSKPNEITYQVKNENLTNVHWHNNSFSLDEDEESKALFDNYSVNAEEVGKSTDLYIQEECVPFEEVVPTSLIEEKNHDGSFTFDGLDESEYTNKKGYIKFTTKAYRQGLYEGHILYHIEVTTEQQKSFRINKNDNLIIAHGNNAETLELEDYPTSGERITPCTVCYAYDPEPKIADKKEKLETNYSCKDGGVYYTFGAGGVSHSDQYSSIFYGNTTVTADYYMVATDTTSVIPSYVHNYNFFVDTLSISFGPSVFGGFSANNYCELMTGQPMTLVGSVY